MTRTPPDRWIEAGLARPRRRRARRGPDRAARRGARASPRAASTGSSTTGGRCSSEMLDRWERTVVDDVIEGVEGEGGDAREKLGSCSASPAGSRCGPSWRSATGRDGTERWRRGCGGSTTAGWSTCAALFSSFCAERMRSRSVACSPSRYGSAITSSPPNTVRLSRDEVVQAGSRRAPGAGGRLCHLRFFASSLSVAVVPYEHAHLSSILALCGEAEAFSSFASDPDRAARALAGPGRDRLIALLRR